MPCTAYVAMQQAVNGTLRTASGAIKAGELLEDTLGEEIFGRGIITKIDGHAQNDRDHYNDD